MKLKIGALIVLVGLSLIGCAQESPYGEGDYQQPVGTPTPEETPSGDTTVTIESYSYNPQSITVKVGTEVTWKNEQSVTHTVTSEEGLFDSGDIEQGETYSYTFEDLGRHNYYCTIHPSMTGEVIVIE